MRIVSPGGDEGPWRGNRVTAHRWARVLEGLGHQVIVEGVLGGAGDLLVALHAVKSAEAIAGWTGELIVALTGTDVYGDIDDPSFGRSIERADRLVVLQPRALDLLPAAAREKARIIFQSCDPAARPGTGGAALGATASIGRAPGDGFLVAVVAHLRPVKDPLLAARALRLLPASSPVRVVHAGAVLDESLGRRARALFAAEPRYRWLGEVPREEALALIAASDLLALTSVAEGGANVVTEALAAGTPVVTTRIEGSLGLLGDDYPGYVSVGDAAALAEMLHRAATDPAFLADLARACRARTPLADPDTEREAWRALLTDLFPAPGGSGAS